MNLKSRLYILSLVVAVIGYGLLIWIDWRIALGVFVCMYAQNLDNSASGRFQESE